METVKQRPTSDCSPPTGLRYLMPSPLPEGPTCRVYKCATCAKLWSGKGARRGEHQSPCLWRLPCTKRDAVLQGHKS